MPKEIIETIGTYLDASGWAAGRLTCQTFRHSITHGISLLEVDLERDAHRWMMVLTCVARLFPRLTSVALLCGSRITPAIFAERMAALSITSIPLQELELRFLYLSSPRVGIWLEDLRGLTELRQLRLLRLAGGATPPPSFFSQLSSMKCLRTLELLPGVYGSIAGFDMDMAHGDAGDGEPTGNMGVGDSHLEAIGHLTQLRQITLRVCPHDTTPAGLAALGAHGLLPELEHLALYDAELPCACLAEHLGGASNLTSLQFGLNSVSGDLGVLTRLTSLKEISLDTAFLPSLHDLVMVAGRCRLPPEGPGGLSGLCLLDQAIGSADQLACLTAFSGLSELVLVNPLSAAAAPGDADSHHPHLPPPPPPQPLQAQPVIDLGVLSGLSGLRLLQVDLGVRSALGAWDGPGQQPQPLPLQLSGAAVAELAGTWTRLETLDLSGFDAELLPDAALAGLSTLTSLRSLSIMHPDGLPHAWQPPLEEDPEFDDAIPPLAHPPQLVPGVAGQGQAAAAAAAAAGGGGGGADAPAAAGGAAGGGGAAAAAGGAGGGGAAAGAGGGGRNGSKQRSWPWWELPGGLVTLCLSHMDISGRGVAQCSLPRAAAATAAAGGGQGKAGAGSSSSGSSSRRAGGRAGAACGSPAAACEGSGPCGCCLVSPAAGAGGGQQQQLLLSGLGLGLGLFQNRGPPLRPLSKRRRQTQQRTDPLEALLEDADADKMVASLAAAAWPADSEAGTGGGAAGGWGHAAGAAAELQLCSCATRLPARFSQLQALWLEHVTLPPTFLSRVLPQLSDSLESLALLQVSGSAPEEMATLAGLTCLTSLRLIPLDHDLGGLEPLLGMKHLKKLSMRLTHLQPHDLGLLPQLRSLFCLSLAAPCVNGGLLPGFPSAVRLQQIEEVVAARLPYCDVELQPDPDLTGL